MEFKNEFLPEQKIAYMRNIGEYGCGNFILMERLKNWAKEKGLYTSTRTIFGIAQDDPNLTNKKDCRYDVGIIIDNDDIIDEEVMQGFIASGRYLIFEIEHTTDAVTHFWQTFYQSLIEHDYQIDDQRPILERYKIELINKHRCEFCVPVI